MSSAIRRPRTGAAGGGTSEYLIVIALIVVALATAWAYFGDLVHR